MINIQTEQRQISIQAYLKWYKEFFKNQSLMGDRTAKFKIPLWLIQVILSQNWLSYVSIFQNSHLRKVFCLQDLVSFRPSYHNLKNKNPSEDSYPCQLNKPMDVNVLLNLTQHLLSWKESDLSFLQNRVHSSLE